jgi:hypothetical protein
MAIAQALQRGEPVDAVRTLDEVGLLDGFFVFLKETGVMKHWSTFTIDAVKRVFLPQRFLPPPIGQITAGHFFSRVATAGKRTGGHNRRPHSA